MPDTEPKVNPPLSWPDLILARGLALAQGLNQPFDPPDHYPDELPTEDCSCAICRARLAEDLASIAALEGRTPENREFSAENRGNALEGHTHEYAPGDDPADYPYEPTAEDWADAHKAQQEMSAASYLDDRRLTLLGLADRQAAFYRGWRNAAGDLFARTMAELAEKIRFTRASTPAEFEARWEVMMADRV